MIKLCLEGEYCQDCPAFECECLEDKIIWYDGTPGRSDFRVVCAHRKQCRVIHDHVLRNKKEKEK